MEDILACIMMLLSLLGYTEGQTCPEIFINNGKISLSDGLNIKSRAKYSCDKGFELDGDRKRFCNSSGWSGSDPSCIAQTCPAPAIDNGNISLSDGLNIESIVSYYCDEGFALVGNRTRECNALGSWSGSEPSCISTQCPAISINNGYISFSDGLNFESRAEYSCDKGFVLVGDRNRFCTASANWNGSDPTCIGLTCPALDITNGKISLSNGLNFGSRAEYSCRKGFELVGDSNRFCNAAGNWSGSDPSCIGPTCPAIGIDHGSISFSAGQNIGSKAKYSCDEGYTFFGQSTRKCNAPGNWSGSDPCCIDVLTLEGIVNDIDVEALESMINDIKNDVALLKRNVLEKTAFSATMYAGQWDITPREVVPFDTARTNIGDDFDITTHKYTCPISGYYFFSASLTFDYDTYPRAVTHRAPKIKKVEVTMMMDSVRISDIMFGGHPYTNSPYGLGSHSVVIFCNEGQKVFLRGDNDAEPYFLKGRSEGDHTHFMGFLLYRQDVLPL